MIAKGDGAGWPRRCVGRDRVAPRHEVDL